MERCPRSAARLVSLKRPTQRPQSVANASVVGLGDSRLSLASSGNPMMPRRDARHVLGQGKAVAVTPSAALLFVSSTDQGGGNRRGDVTLRCIWRMILSDAVKLPRRRQLALRANLRSEVAQCVKQARPCVAVLADDSHRKQSGFLVRQLQPVPGIALSADQIGHLHLAPVPLPFCADKNADEHNTTARL
jgi:hypothetical protein